MTDATATVAVATPTVEDPPQGGDASTPTRPRPAGSPSSSCSSSACCGSSRRSARSSRRSDR